MNDIHKINNTIIIQIAIVILVYNSILISFSYFKLLYS